jgi:hypothetical protein
MKFVELSGLLGRTINDESALSATHQFTAKDSSGEKIIDDAQNRGRREAAGLRLGPFRAATFFRQSVVQGVTIRRR